MNNNLKRFGGVISIVALLVVLAGTPSEAGLGGVTRFVSTPMDVSTEFVALGADDSDAVSLPWYSSVVQAFLGFTRSW